MQSNRPPAENPDPDDGLHRHRPGRDRPVAGRPQDHDGFGVPDMPGSQLGPGHHPGTGETQGLGRPEHDAGYGQRPQGADQFLAHQRGAVVGGPGGDERHGQPDRGAPEWRPSPPSDGVFGVSNNGPMDPGRPGVDRGFGGSPGSGPQGSRDGYGVPHGLGPQSQVPEGPGAHRPDVTYGSPHEPGSQGPGSHGLGPGPQGPGSHGMGPGSQGPGSHGMGPGPQGPGSHGMGPGSQGPGSHGMGPGPQIKGPQGMPQRGNEAGFGGAQGLPPRGRGSDFAGQPGGGPQGHSGDGQARPPMSDATGRHGPSNGGQGWPGSGQQPGIDPAGQGRPAEGPGGIGAVNRYPGAGYETGDRYDPMDHYALNEGQARQTDPATLAARQEPLGGARQRGRGGPQRVKAGGPGPRRNNKPSEPSKIVLALGLSVVVIAAIVAVIVLNNGGDDTAEGDSEATNADVVQDTETTASSTPSVQNTVTVAAPNIAFDAAAKGPVESATPYQLDVKDGPEGATLYQVVVDDVPQGEAAALLPPVSFEPGYHVVRIDVTHPSGVVSSKPVAVYALAASPEVTYRANLASVSVADQGWEQAVISYQDFVKAGHTELEIYPSDRIPNLPTGFWNLFVGGFESAEAANGYCQQMGLEVGVTCFSVKADPNAAPAG